MRWRSPGGEEHSRQSHSALLTARITRSMPTGASPSAGHSLAEVRPRTMFTAITRSSIVTRPEVSQSPTHGAVSARAVIPQSSRERQDSEVA